jgi:hypothetical protein
MGSVNERRKPTYGPGTRLARVAFALFNGPFGWGFDGTRREQNVSDPTLLRSTRGSREELVDWTERGVTRWGRALAIGFSWMAIACGPAASRPTSSIVDVVARERRALEELALVMGPVAGGSTASRGELPPHMHEVSLGLFECDRGFVMTVASCVSEDMMVRGPQFEISSLRSAGGGAPGTCPSGGCRPRFVSLHPHVERRSYFSGRGFRSYNRDRH